MMLMIADRMLGMHAWAPSGPKLSMLPAMQAWSPRLLILRSVMFNSCSFAAISACVDRPASFQNASPES